MPPDQSLRGLNADILSIDTPRSGTEQQEIGQRLNKLERAGKKTQKENLETDTGTRSKLENIRYLLTLFTSNSASFLTTHFEPVLITARISTMIAKFA